MADPLDILSLDDAKAHLRVVGDDEDVSLASDIAAAVAALEDFLGRPLIAATSWATTDAIPANVIHAVKLVLGEIYEDRLGPLQDMTSVRNLVGRWVRVSVG